MSTYLIRLLGLLLAIGLFGEQVVYAAIPTDSIEKKISLALHGPDGEGRDGPMSKLDRDLIALYYRYNAFQDTSQTETFSSQDESLLIRDSLVTVEVIAAKSAQALLDSLTALGLREAAQAERLISGKLPILSLRKAAQLSALQSMRSSKGKTGVRSGSIGDPRETDKSGEKKEISDRDVHSKSDSVEASSVPEDRKRNRQSASDWRFPIWYVLAGAFLVGVAWILTFRKGTTGGD